MEFPPTDPSNSTIEAGLQASDLQGSDVGLGGDTVFIVFERHSTFYIHEALCRSRPALNV